MPPTPTGTSQPGPDLSVVVPVHNAEGSIAGLVTHLLATERLSVEVILVDDASTDASASILADLAAQHREVTVIHHQDNAGAGVARNDGFACVAARYTLFFDADDHIDTDVLGEIVPRLDATGADVAFTSYHYQRGSRPEHRDMNDFDVATWQRLMEVHGHLATVRLDDEPGLLGFSNYPWNKVIRTTRYHEVGLRFGKGSVHNDILGHWYTMLFARTVLLVDRELCTHIVDPGGGNLTNHRTRERLQLFEALDETYDLLEAEPAWRNRYSHHYWAFAIRTAKWAANRVAEEWRHEFNIALQQHMLRVSLADFARIRMVRDPALASEILIAALR